uniref:Uncharacterized protein n=1 Tax=Timema poppense TaxID=170557 RepID=A0A7R9CVW2_TIMPO|nr:unnamed protein product [Timema poppensis]
MSAINDTYTVKFSSTKRKMLTPGAVPSMNLPTDTLVPPDEPTRKYLCPNRQPVPTISVKIEHYCTESFEMEDTKPILGCVGSEMQLNSHIHFSNETILGLEVDYINRDSNNETLSLAHTTNDSDSCTLPPIKEEPKVEFETLEESLKFEIKENDAHDTNTEMALSSFPPTKEPKVKEGFGDQINLCRDQGLNPGPPAQKSDTLPLDRQVTDM